MQTKIFNALKVSLFAIVLSFGLSYVYAWTAPIVPPTGGNVPAPINVGASPQTKTGGLTVASLNAGGGSISTTGNILGWNIGANSLTTNSLRVSGATAGQVLTAQNAAGDVVWQTPAASGGAHGKQRFTSNGNFIVPAGVTTVWITMAGGGGGGGANGGEGGGGAHAVVAQPVSVTPLTLYPVTIGAGGAGGTDNGWGAYTNGTSGGTSSFGGLLVTPGGSGGRYWGNSVPASAGAPGGTGGTAGGRTGGTPSTHAVVVLGGSSIFGAGAVRSGANAGGYGAGGAGGSSGGAGSPGFVLVEW